MTKKISLCLLAWFLPYLLFAQTYIGRAVKISDGDTFILQLADKSTIRIRLYGIDCPEKGQDYSSVATTYSKNFLINKTITAIQKDTDRYGRIVATVYVNNKCLNEALLENGLAWHYTQHDSNKSWSYLESEARNKKLNLWKTKKPVAPWLWRKNKKST